MDLSALDKLFSAFFRWFTRLYDPGSGGFYYAHSSLKEDRFRPDIESTAQAVNIMQMTGTSRLLGPEAKHKVISFFRSRQDRDGYFTDPHNSMREFDRMKARALAYSIEALKELGASPLYKPPGTVTGRLPVHLQSEENYIRWLEERPWEDAWMACDNISAASVYFRYMNPQRQKRFTRLTAGWLAERQDPDGLWSRGRPLVRISGTFKLALFYRNCGLEMPEPQKIFGSLKAALQEDRADDFCWVRNPVELLSVLIRNGLEPSEKELSFIFSHTLENLQIFLRPDGGFSRHRTCSLAVPNNVELGLGLEEGDMNASTQAVRVRKLFHGFYSTEMKAFPDEQLISGL